MKFIASPSCHLFQSDDDYEVEDVWASTIRYEGNWEAIATVYGPSPTIACERAANIAEAMNKVMLPVMGD